MITCTELDNGNLQLTINESDKQELLDNLQERGFWTTFCDAMESYSCNGSFTPFDAGQGNPFVGLTDAPCIAESMDYLDNGDAEIVGEFWYFDNYMLECPLEKLANDGQVIFNLAR